MDKKKYQAGLKEGKDYAVLKPKARSMGELLSSEFASPAGVIGSYIGDRTGARDKRIPLPKSSPKRVAKEIRGKVKKAVTESRRKKAARKNQESMDYGDVSAKSGKYMKKCGGAVMKARGGMFKGTF